MLGWSFFGLAVLACSLLGVVFWRIGTGLLWLGAGMGTIAHTYEHSCGEHVYDEDVN